MPQTIRYSIYIYNIVNLVDIRYKKLHNNIMTIYITIFQIGLLSCSWSTGKGKSGHDRAHSRPVTSMVPDVSAGGWWEREAVDATPEALEAILNGPGAIDLCEIEAGGRYEEWAGVLHLPIECSKETSLHGFDWTVWADPRLEKGSRTWRYAGCFGGILANLKFRPVTDDCAKIVLQVHTPQPKVRF
jgi:hypothetical protein